jgi:hypothetical protein
MVPSFSLKVVQMPVTISCIWSPLCWTPRPDPSRSVPCRNSMPTPDGADGLELLALLRVERQHRPLHRDGRDGQVALLAAALPR